VIAEYTASFETSEQVTQENVEGAITDASQNNEFGDFVVDSVNNEGTQAIRLAYYSIAILCSTAFQRL